MDPSQVESPPSEPSGLQIERAAGTPRRLTRRWLLALTALIVSAAGSTVWLTAHGNRSREIGPVSVDPAYIVVNTPTPVTFRAEIKDSRFNRVRTRSVLLLRTDDDGKPVDIVGRLRDDGRDGDTKRNDRIYTLVTTLNEPAVGQVTFKIAASFGRTFPFQKWSDKDDYDWDRDISDLSSSRRRNSHHDKLRLLIRRLTSYGVSDVFQVTVDPFPLPPDPGEAGKQTLEGIDSDNDGVRDDVQRWIAVRYPTSLETRSALGDYAQALQDVLGEDDTATAITLTHERFRASDCIEYLTGDANGLLWRELMTLTLNTPERARAFFVKEEMFSGQVFGGLLESQLASACAAEAPGQ
jgi:hypothetical protein